MFFLCGIVGKARASFRQSFRFGSMNIRDRGLRLAGYLTPPSDITQEDDDNPDKLAGCSGGNASGGTNPQSGVLRVDKPPWAQLSAPALTSTGDLDKDYTNAASAYVTDEIRINVPNIVPNKVSYI